MSKVIRSRFVDSIQLIVRGGDGGHGLPKYGGIGGSGGDVRFEATKFQSLGQVAKKYPKKVIAAENGENSKRSRLLAAKGADTVLKVPIGVAIYDEANKKMGELNEVGNEIVVAKGGAGGSRTTNPAFTGVMGQERTITIDLKLIADVGLVGFPNAGKSTLLKAMSRATPKIASYAFTTIKPNLGVLEYDDLRQISMADLPGLIEGASKNVGMGHKFLKHVERTSLLLMVVDVDGFQWKPDDPYRSCLETIILLNKELELYNKELLDKPFVLAVNKMDRDGASEKLSELQSVLRNLNEYITTNTPPDIRPERSIAFEEIVPISARFDRHSVLTLKDTIRRVMDEVYARQNEAMFKKSEKSLVKRMKKLNRVMGDRYL